MKRTLLIVSLLTGVVFVNVFFSMSGCTSKQAVKAGENLPNRFAILPGDIPAETQKAADNFSWQTFIAMNWPADTNTCGPDTSGGINIISSRGPVVWETYLTTDQVFVTAPGVPDKWCMTGSKSSKFQSLPQGVKELARKTGVYRFIHRIAKAPSGLEQASGGPVVDQNGRFARYEVRMNQDEYNYIVAKSLWDSAGQKKFPADSTITMPAGPSGYGRAGAMEFKAAWKVLGKGDDPSRFYTIRAIVYNDNSGDPSPGKNPVTLGLVGLHIAHKTATQKNWVWSTFEQVDNLTKSFFNPACDTCTPNKPLQGSNYMELNPDGTPHNKPTQVTRVNNINDPFADSLNRQYRAMLKGSVWANYQLVSTQWLLFENMFPSYLANSVQETYLQGPNPPSYGGFPLQPDQAYYKSPKYQPFANGISASCMGCHYTATLKNSPVKTDFSFLLYEAH